MAIEKIITYDHQVTVMGDIHVRRVTRIMEDGVEISKTYHRHVVHPQDDVSNEDERTRLLHAALDSELVEIREGLADAEEVTEGETVEGEEIKKQTWLERLKEYWSNLE